MAESRPMLIFLSGPQRGERDALKRAAVFGRAPDCDLVLTETHVSRQQMRLEPTAEGWVMENLSSNGTKVNGKRYKAGSRVLLDTGDVLGVGLETDILFVDSDDDPEAALDAYCKAHPEPEALPATPPKTEPIAEEEPKTATKPLTTKAPSLPVDAAAAARKAKLRKYAILFAVYAVVLIVGIVFLKGLKKGPDAQISGLPPRLTNEQISTALDEPFQRSFDPTAAATALKEALACYDRRAVKTRDLFNCFMLFKLHLAYKRTPEFDSPENSRKFSEVRNELVKYVCDEYEAACDRERASTGYLPEARNRLDNLINNMPPDPRWSNAPGFNSLLDNIRQHSTYVVSKIRRK